LVVGIGSLFALGLEPAVSRGAEGPTALPTSALVALMSQEGPVLEPTATPAPSATPAPALPPVELPEVPVPAGGQVYMLTPAAPGAAGWARDHDDVVNHLGDYNIYAGFFEGNTHVGVIQFDLSSVPPGAPIIHADLTLTGLSADWLGADGSWTVQLMQPWIDEGWGERDFHWFSRPDSGAATLVFSLAPGDLHVGESNTVFFTPEGLPLLEARLYAGKVSFRIVGPKESGNNLFGWDSGYGSRSMGRGPILRIIAGPAPASPPPSPTPDYVVITPIPEDEQLVALAEQMMTATAQAVPYTGPETPTPIATATPLPPNWVTPVIIVPTATPENAATAQWVAQVATAQAIVQGTPTQLPPNAWTATPAPPTPAPTATPMLLAFDQLTATPTATPTPTAIPDLLRGKILFYSDRFGGATLMIMNPDGSDVSVWAADAGEWLYQRTKSGADVSPDGRFRVIVSDNQLDMFPDHKLEHVELFVVPLADQGKPESITRRDELKAMSYDAVWSPTDARIAFVSAGPGNDEIFTIRPDGSELTRLTVNQWEWDKHPSWSPDGSQIVFWSNRDTQRKQIWVMSADGSGQRNISNNEYNDWDPVWVK
jgi:hypothetical protein